jgi:hypothetical protein
MRAALVGAHDEALDIVFLCNRLELVRDATDEVLSDAFRQAIVVIAGNHDVV